MAEVTRKQLADELGCDKQTVSRAMKELSGELEGHVVRRGQVDCLDEYAASAVSARLSGRFPRPRPAAAATEPAPDVYRVLYEQTRADREADAERYRAQIDGLASEVSALRSQADAERRRADRLSERLEALAAEAAASAGEAAGARAELEAARAALAAVAGAGLLSARRVARGYLALPPGGEG